MAGGRSLLGDDADQPDTFGKLDESMYCSGSFWARNLVRAGQVAQTLAVLALAMLTHARCPPQAVTPCRAIPRSLFWAIPRVMFPLPLGLV